MLAKKTPRFVSALVGIALLSALLTTAVATHLVSVKAASASPHTWQAVIGSESQDLAIQGMAFLPGALWINVGDTVVWTIKGGDIHTVTFLKPHQTLPPFNGSKNQVFPQGGSVYDGVSYFNSGLMSSVFPGPGGTSYTLSFGVTGDFTYHCLVHPSMLGIVHVRPAGTPYPYTQGDYNHQIFSQTQFILSDGNKLDEQARNQSNSLNVTDGTGDGLVSVMRFIPYSIFVHVGDTITFTNRDPMEPHTVTFGTLPPHTSDFAPIGNRHNFDGSKVLNSGFIGSNPAWFGTTFKVTFVKAGTYAFRCDLHEFLGMVATITVLP